jgi:hypothetical protein
MLYCFIALLMLHLTVVPFSSYVVSCTHATVCTLLLSKSHLAIHALLPYHHSFRTLVLLCLGDCCFTTLHHHTLFFLHCALLLVTCYSHLATLPSLPCHRALLPCHHTLLLCLLGCWALLPNCSPFQVPILPPPPLLLCCLVAHCHTLLLCLISW